MNDILVTAASASSSPSAADAELGSSVAGAMKRSELRRVPASIPRQRVVSPPLSRLSSRSAVVGRSPGLRDRGRARARAQVRGKPPGEPSRPPAPTKIDAQAPSERSGRRRAGCSDGHRTPGDLAPPVAPPPEPTPTAACATRR